MPPRLSKIDPSTGKPEQIGPSIVNLVQSAQLSSVDEKNQIYYVLGLNTTDSHPHLIGIHLNNGSILYNVAMPFKEYSYVGIGQTINVDPVSGDVFVSWFDTTVHNIARVVPKTGALTPISTIRYNDFYTSASCFDPVNRLLWMQLLDHRQVPLFALNVETKQWVYSNVNNTFNMQTFDFDSETGLIYGIGYVLKPEGQYARVLVSLNSSAAFSLVGTIDGYGILNADMATIDVKNRKLYSVLQEYKHDSPFHLISVDLNTATVSTHPEVKRETFPRSIEFINDEKRY